MLRSVLRRFALSGALVLSFAGSAFGQNAVSVAGFGYSLPANSVSAAPGQLMVVSVAGLNLSLDGPIQGIPGNSGLPTELKGVAVDFVQGPVTVQIGLIGLQAERLLRRFPVRPFHQYHAPGPV